MDNKWLNGKRKVCRSKVKRLEKCKLFKKTVEIIDSKKTYLIRKDYFIKNLFSII